MELSGDVRARSLGGNGDQAKEVVVMARSERLTGRWGYYRIRGRRERKQV